MNPTSSSPPNSTVVLADRRLTPSPPPDTHPKRESSNSIAASSGKSNSPLLNPEDDDCLSPLLSPSGSASTRPLHSLATAIAKDEVNGIGEPPRDVGPTERSHTQQLDVAATTYAHDRALRTKDAEIARLRRTIQELSVQLNNALHTLDARVDAAAELKALEAASVAEEERREAAVRSVRLEMLENRVKYRTMEEKLASKYESDVEAKAVELLSTHTKEVHDTNFELLKEKLLLAQEVTRSRAEYRELQDSYKKLRQETDLDVSAKKQMLQRNVIQKNEITSLRQQVKTSEDNLNAVVGEYDRKLAEQERRHLAEINALTKERDAARRDALRLKRDFSQLRSTASTVLSQRSDLEDFFYSALEEVRLRVIEERRQQLTGGRPGASQDARVTVFSSPQTASMLLRLESTDRRLITGNTSVSSAANASSSRSNWKVDHKGFPKRSDEASGRQSAAAADGADPSPNSVLPPVASTSRGCSSVPVVPLQNGTGTLVSVPSAMPAYLRADVDDDTAFSPPPVSRDDRGSALAGSQSSRRPPSSTAALESGAGSPSQEVPMLRSLPKNPTWKDVKEVDVASLSWAEKERVIQLLFKRIRDEGRHRKKANDKETAPTAEAGPWKMATPAVPPHFDRDVDSSTFLTQN
ncbi:hypothetical protein ABL78_0300 [Leptomonas seymouri]|uniref:Uncharacterized protein n=1 Tax=Leptomonas seymouri TaxID=5684 RepID=A0A0N1IMK1_LEPSE|nr:hypothetical protein ABL78_0300 [Leptomonas seymouri]|eukprot:KPI90540.1 hypothetical protein ABL78_0300 [Leptomonas seymouri]